MREYVYMSLAGQPEEDGHTIYVDTCIAFIH